MEKKVRMVRFLESCYVPKDKKDEFASTLTFLANNDVRDVETADAWKTGVKVLILDIAGRGKYETFHGADVKNADFADVNGTYANAYVYEEGKRGYPKRVFRTSNKFGIIIEKEK